MADAIAHFEQTPWCAALIRDSAWTPTRTGSRVPKPTTEDSFFAETLGTDRTIRYCLTLRPTESRKEDPEFLEVKTILDLGSGLNGHPNICHGGFVATLMDEVFGVLIMLNLERKKKMQGPHSQMHTFTAYLNVNYKKPVPTPSIVLCTATVDRRERNKIYVKGTLEDGLGKIYTTAEGMFVEVNSKL